MGRPGQSQLLWFICRPEGLAEQYIYAPCMGASLACIVLKTSGPRVFTCCSMVECVMFRGCHEAPALLGVTATADQQACCYVHILSRTVLTALLFCMRAHAGLESSHCSSWAASCLLQQLCWAKEPTRLTN